MVSILKRHRAQPLGVRCIFEMASKHSITTISIVQNVVKERTEPKAGLLTNEPFNALLQQYFSNPNLNWLFLERILIILHFTGADNDKEIRIKTRRTQVHM
jgi:hypothetical protein